MHRFIHNIILLSLLMLWVSCSAPTPSLPSGPRQPGSDQVDQLNLRAFEEKRRFPARGLSLAQQAQHMADSLHYEKGKADALHISGLLHLYLGNYAQSITQLYQAFQIREKLGDSTGLGRSCNNLGLVYARDGKYPQALRWYQRSLDIRIQQGDSLGMVYTLLSLAEVHAQLTDMDKATHYAEEAMTYAGLIGDDRARALGYSIMGDLALQKGQLFEAKFNHNLALNIRSHLQDHYEKPRNLIALGEIARQTADYPTAKASLGKALSIALETKGLAWEIQAREALARLYADQAQYEQAYQMEIQAKAKEDSLHHIEESQRQSALEISYQLSFQQNQIDLLEEKQANQRLRIIGLLGVIALILLLGTLGFFYYRYRLLTHSHRQLAKKQAEIEAKNKELEFFADRLAHDLKEPLRTVASYTQLVERNYGDALDERGKLFSQFIAEGVRRMDRLVVELLRYAKLGHEDLSFAPISLNALIDEVRAHIHQAIADSGATFSVADLPTVEADRTALFQVFQNLFTNAIKFARKKTPHIHISYEDGGRYHIIRVQDEGIGMSPDFQQRAFMAFAREHSRSQYEGTGLGLAICAKVMEAHHGSITVQSEEGIGTTFTLRLPKRLLQKEA